MTRNIIENVNDGVDIITEIPKSESPEKKRQISKKGKKNRNQRPNIVFISAATVIVGILLNLFLVNIGITNGARNLFGTFLDTKNRVASETEKDITDDLTKRAENATHTANRVDLNISNIRETAALEIMEVCDVEYIVEKPTDNSHNYERWAKTSGRAIYTVNLEESEFLVDNLRKTVYIRIPKIEYKIVDLKTIPLLIHDGLNLELDWTSLSAIGAEIALKQENQGEEKVRKEFDTNPQYIAEAKNAAKEVLTQLVKGLNPNHKDEITVIVEFDE